MAERRAAGRVIFLEKSAQRGTRFAQVTSEFTLEETPMSKYLRRFVTEEEGADATEYALVIGLVALAIVGAVGLLGTNLGNAFNDIANKVKANVN